MRVVDIWRLPLVHCKSFSDDPQKHRHKKKRTACSLLRRFPFLCSLSYSLIHKRMSSPLDCIRADSHARPTDLALCNIDVREALHTPRRHLNLLRGRRRRRGGRRPIHARRRSRIRMAGDAARLATELEVPTLKALPRRALVDRDSYPRRIERISNKGPVGRVLFNEGFKKDIFWRAPCVVEPFFIVFWRVRDNGTADARWLNAVEEFFEGKEQMRRGPRYQQWIIQVQTYQKVARR